MDIFYLILGLVLVIVGANIMTEGASGIASRFGVSEFIIGATVIAIGTSAPELIVSLLSAARGETAIALGNVVGSNMFNTLVIVGITAIILPMPLTANNVRKDIPFGVLATIVLIICAADPWLDNSAAAVISRTEGLLLLCFFAVFPAYTIFSQSTLECDRNGSPRKTDGSAPAESPASTKQRKLWVQILFTAGGSGGLSWVVTCSWTAPSLWPTASI